MHSRRWVLALVITLMLIDSWVKRAEAKSIEPARATAATPGLAIQLMVPPMVAR
jgi:hypothetical protein